MITILISTASWRIPLRKHRFSTMLSSENHFQAPLSPETFRHSPTSWRLPWALASWPCPVPSHTQDMWMAPFSRWSLDRWPSTACTFWWVFGGSHIEISLLKIFICFADQMHVHIVQAAAGSLRQLLAGHESGTQTRSTLAALFGTHCRVSEVTRQNNCYL